MAEQMITANGVELCAETFGERGMPAVLLSMGAMASMIWWEDEFCARLAAGARFVIRYDNRDTGRSVNYGPGAPRFTLDDLVGDSFGVLEAFGVQRAHVVGMSLGGIVAQIMALKQPTRLASIALVASTPVGLEPGAPELPPIDPRVIAYHVSGATLDWSDERAVLDYMTAGRNVLVGHGRRFDEATARELSAREIRRAVDLKSMLNYAQLTGGDAYAGRLGEIRVPTLVIHGSDDPVLPYPHALALAERIPGAELITLEGAGHELHRDDWEVVIDALLRHTR